MSLVDQFVTDMQLLNDAQPAGMDVGHQKTHRAVIVMGRLFQGRAAPTYFLDALRPDLRQSYTANPWTKVRGWLVAVRSPGSNRFVNARIAVRNFQLMALYQGAPAWTAIASTNPNDGNYYDGNVHNPYGPAARRVVAGVTEFKQSTNPGWHNIHIYGPTALGVNGANVVGLHGRCEARLVIDDVGLPDDRSTARLLLNLGVDLYPNDAAEVNRGDFEWADWGPGSGGNRFRFLTNDWNLFTFSTLRPNADPNPNMPVVETWQIAASVAERSMTEAAFRALPPPTDDIPVQPDTPALSVPASAQAGAVVRARFTSATGTPIAGATVSWQGPQGGVIYGGTTNDAGVVAVRLTATGGFTLSATGGGVTASAQITVQTATVVNAIVDSETPSGWALTGASPAASMTMGQADIYGGTRWGRFKMGGPASGDPSSVSRQLSSLASSGRIGGATFAKRVAHDWVVLYVYGSMSAPHASARAWFNLATGALGAVESLGSASNPVATIEPWGDGIFRLTLHADVSDGGGPSMLQVRVDGGNQAFTYPANAEVILGGWELHPGTVVGHLPTDLVTAVQIQPKTLAMARTGQPYGEQITCTGVPPITWSISSGSLPAGITADTGQTGTTLTLSGANVTATAGSTFTVSATDGSGGDSESFTIPVEQTDDDPTTLAAVPANSDTIDLTWIVNAPNAIDTVIESRFNDGGWSAWAPVATVGPQAESVSVTGLRPGTPHEFRVFQNVPSGRTGYSNVAGAATFRLLVRGHFEPTGAGVTGCRVTIGRGADPDTGLLMSPTLLPPVTDATMDLDVVTWNGTPHSRMVVELDQQIDPPLRDGNLIDMVVEADVGGKSMQSKILHGARDYGAVVVETP